MRRFWIDRSCLQDNKFLIKGSLYHHICRVSQIKKGETLDLFCEGLQKYEVVLSSVFSSKAIADILKIHPVPPLKKPYLHLALSLPKPSKVGFLIEKMVELGVKEFHPFVSDFSFFKNPAKFSSVHQKRWNKIAQQSMALSGRTEPISIYPCQFLQEIRIPKSDLALLAYEGKNPKTNLKNALKASPQALWLFIGSEGGFSLNEVEEFSKKSKAFVFSMGERILKVETACLFGLSLLKYHYHL